MKWLLHDGQLKSDRRDLVQSVSFLMQSLHSEKKKKIFSRVVLNFFPWLYTCALCILPLHTIFSSAKDVNKYTKITLNKESRWIECTEILENIKCSLFVTALEACFIFENNCEINLNEMIS